MNFWLKKCVIGISSQSSAARTPRKRELCFALLCGMLCFAGWIRLHLRLVWCNLIATLFSSKLLMRIPGSERHLTISLAILTKYRSFFDQVCISWNDLYTNLQKVGMYKVGMLKEDRIFEGYLNSTCWHSIFVLHRALHVLDCISMLDEWCANIITFRPSLDCSESVHLMIRLSEAAAQHSALSRHAMNICCIAILSTGPAPRWRQYEIWKLTLWCIGATTMGTGGDKSKGWGDRQCIGPPQLLVITFSIMHKICMKHARCIVMRQRSM